MSAKTTEKNRRLAILSQVAPAAEKLGLALLDAVYVRENGRMVLRLIIDRKGGVGTADCEKLSAVADPMISETLGITDFDVFEVSSPGLDRPLRTIDDCIRHEGDYVHVSLYQAVDGKKRFSGELAVDDKSNAVGVVTEDGERKMFFLKDIANIKRDIVF